MPTVSVIVPNYNYARFLPKRLESVLRQTYQDIEVILLDDCSTDDSRAILSKYAAADPRVVRLEFNEVNSGNTFKQWNKGVGFARGEYVWIAEADDYADEHLLERLVSILKSDPSVVFAYCRSFQIDEDDRLNGFVDSGLAYLDAQKWTRDFCTDGLDECRTYLVRVNTVPNGSAVVFRRALYNSLGAADEGLRLCGDWKMWAAMALKGKIAYIGEPLNYFRFHTSSVRSRTDPRGTHVAEDLQVSGWILKHMAAPDNLVNAILQQKAHLWTPVIMSFKTPLQVKRTLLRHVKSMDPHPVRRAIGPALRTVQRKFLRHWRSASARVA